MPVIGLLSSQSSSGYAPLMAAFREGLREAGFVEGQKCDDRVPLGRGQPIVCRGWLLIWSIGGLP